jgi:hypothetical protein
LVVIDAIAEGHTVAHEYQRCFGCCRGIRHGAVAIRQNRKRRFRELVASRLKGVTARIGDQARIQVSLVAEVAETERIEARQQPFAQQQRENDSDQDSDQAAARRLTQTSPPVPNNWVQLASTCCV